MPAVLDLVPYLLLFLALAIVLSLRAFIQATRIIIGATVGKIPLLGSLLAPAFSSVASSITQVLDAQVRNIDAAIGASWHVTADLLSWFERQFREAAHLTQAVAHTLYQFASKDYITVALRELRHLIHSLTHAGSIALRETIVINKKVDTTVAHTVVPGLKRLEHEAEVVIPRDIGELRARTKALDREYERLYRWIRTHPWTAATTAFTGAVAVALARLGGSWIRCDNWKGIGRSVCGLPGSLISELLSGVLDVLVLTDLCELVAGMSQVAQAFVPEIDAIVGTASGLIGCHGTTAPKQWAAQGVSLAPVNNPLTWH